MKVTKKPTVLLERFPYRYIQVGKLEINDMPDCRIQKVDAYTGCLLYTSDAADEL